MFVNRAVQFVVFTAAVLWESKTNAATKTSVKFCGRQLSEIMSRVCHAYNSPSWDVPTVIEQPGSVVRRKRQLGIADECCMIGCTWEQLSEYCSIRAYSESPLEDLAAHIIADRSAEQEGGAGNAKSVTKKENGVVGDEQSGSRGERGARREVGRTRSRGYGRARGRCWCRRRRSGRRRSSLMGSGKKCSTRCASSRNSVASYNLGQDSQH